MHFLILRRVFFKSLPNCSGFYNCILNIGKDFFFKKIKSLCREPGWKALVSRELASSALGKDDVNFDVPRRRRGLCRGRSWPSAKYLSRACHVALGKEFFAESFFAESHMTGSRQRLCRGLLGLC